MCLHFGERYEMGVIVNNQLPDYSGIPLGDPIYENEDLEKVMEKKRQLESKRLRTIGVNPFFDDDELAETFYTSENFTQLIEFYNNEFNLEVIRRTANEMIVKDDDFYFPTEATDEQMLRIQKLLGFYFFEIRQGSMKINIV